MTMSKINIPLNERIVVALNVGDPEKAKGLVEDIPVVRVEIVPAGHLMAAENPAQINGLILDFFGQF